LLLASTHILDMNLSMYNLKIYRKNNVFSINLFSNVILLYLDGNMTNTLKKEFATDALAESPFEPIVADALLDECPRNGTLYEFSVAPEAQHLYTDKDTRLSEFYATWIPRFKEILSDVATYDLITEVSTPKYLRYIPGVVNRLHFHGYITFKDIRAFFVERSHYLLMFSTFKISNFRKVEWPKYLEKQRYLMEPNNPHYHITNPPTPQPIKLLVRESEAAQHRGELEARSKQGKKDQSERAGRVSTTKRHANTALDLDF